MPIVVHITSAKVVNVMMMMQLVGQTGAAGGGGEGLGGGWGQGRGRLFGAGGVGPCVPQRCRSVQQEVLTQTHSGAYRHRVGAGVGQASALPGAGALVCQPGRNVCNACNMRVCVPQAGGVAINGPFCGMGCDQLHARARGDQHGVPATFGCIECCSCVMLGCTGQNNQQQELSTHRDPISHGVSQHVGYPNMVRAPHKRRDSAISLGEQRFSKPRKLQHIALFGRLPRPAVQKQAK